MTLEVSTFPNNKPAAARQIGLRLIAGFKLGPSYQASQHRISVSENKRVRRDAMHLDAARSRLPVRVGVDSEIPGFRCAHAATRR